MEREWRQRNCKIRKWRVQKNRGNNRNRQIEGRRASVADREGGWQDVNSEHIQELPRKEELKRYTAAIYISAAFRDYAFL